MKSTQGGDRKSNTQNEYLKTSEKLAEQFTISERVAIARAIEEEIGNRQGQRNDIPRLDGGMSDLWQADQQRQLPQNFAEVKGKETAEIAAERAGFGNKETYRQAKKVVNEGTEELVDKVDKGEISVSLAATVAEMPE